MADKIIVKIIIQRDGGDQEDIEMNFEYHDESWEEECYQLGCSVAREVGVRVLRDIEERLFQEHPKGMKVHDSFERTRVTRFG